MRKTSADGLEKLMKREGTRKKAYLDTKGIPTIGVGHTGPEVYLGLVWTMDQVKATLAKDVEICERCIDMYVAVPLTQFQFDALVSFIFNVGTGAFMRSTMLKKINQGDMEGAAKEFDRWHIPPEIIRRRDSERDQFLGQ